MKLFNFIYETFIQCWLLLVAFIVVYGIGTGVCELILFGINR